MKKRIWILITLITLISRGTLQAMEDQLLDKEEVLQEWNNFKSRPAEELEQWLKSDPQIQEKLFLLFDYFRKQQSMDEAKLLFNLLEDKAALKKEATIKEWKKLKEGPADELERWLESNPFQAEEKLEMLLSYFKEQNSDEAQLKEQNSDEAQLIENLLQDVREAKVSAFITESMEEEREIERQRHEQIMQKLYPRGRK